MCETTTDGGDAYARTLATRSTVYACGCVCRLRLDDSNLDALESGVDWCTHISYVFNPPVWPCERAVCVANTVGLYDVLYRWGGRANRACQHSWLCGVGVMR